jgi:hypothetical protein
MPTSLEALRIFLLLLPGFVSMKISDALRARHERADLAFIIDSLVFAFVNLAIFSVLVRWLYMEADQMLATLGFAAVSTTVAGGVNLASYISRASVGLLCLSVVTGLLHHPLRKGFYWLMLRARLTGSTGRPNVWQDTFLTHSRQWVRVYLEDGRIAQGWPTYFSDGEKTELFLSNVTCYRPDGTSEKLEGLLLTAESKFKLVEFPLEPEEVEESTKEPPQDQSGGPVGGQRLPEEVEEFTEEPSGDRDWR